MTTPIAGRCPWRQCLALGGLAVALAACALPTATPPPAPAPAVGRLDVQPAIVPAPAFVETGEASWYGRELAGSPTASGAPFDPAALTAAHPSLPFGTTVRVVNLANGRSVQVVINDRGPFAGRRIIDLSQAAARALGFERDGTALVRLEAAVRADPAGGA